MKIDAEPVAVDLIEDGFGDGHGTGGASTSIPHSGHTPDVLSVRS